MMLGAGGLAALAERRPVLLVFDAGFDDLFTLNERQLVECLDFGQLCFGGGGGGRGGVGRGGGGGGRGGLFVDGELLELPCGDPHREGLDGL